MVLEKVSRLKYGDFLGGGLKYVFYVHPYLGKRSNLTTIFQMGWFNHQLVLVIYVRFFAVGAHESCKALHFPWNLFN